MPSTVTTSENWLSESRKVKVGISLGNGSYDDNIQTLTITENVDISNALGLGTTNASMLELTLIGVTGSILNDIKRYDKIAVYAGVSKEGTTPSLTTALGVYYVDSVKSKRGNGGSDRYTIEIVAYSALSRLTDTGGGELEYLYANGNVDPPSSISLGEVIDDIKERIVVNIIKDTFNKDLILDLTRLPDSITTREVLGYLASASGGCCVTDHSTGSIYCKWTNNSSTFPTISKDYQHIDGFEYYVNKNLTSEMGETTPVHLGYLACTNGTTGGMTSAQVGNKQTKVYGSDYISFKNPFLRNKTYFDELAINVLNANMRQYTPFTVKWRGDPNIQLLDMVTVETPEGGTVTGIVMENKLEFDGSLIQTISCYPPDVTNYGYNCDTEDPEGSEREDKGGSKDNHLYGLGLYIYPVTESGDIPDNYMTVQPMWVEISEGNIDINLININMDLSLLTSGLYYRIPLPYVRVDPTINNIYVLPKIGTKKSGVINLSDNMSTNTGTGMGDIYTAKIKSHDFTSEGISRTGSVLEIYTDSLFEDYVIVIATKNAFNTGINSMCDVIEALSTYDAEGSCYPYNPDKIE